MSSEFRPDSFGTFLATMRRAKEARQSEIATRGMESAGEKRKESRAMELLQFLTINPQLTQEVYGRSGFTLAEFSVALENLRRTRLVEVDSEKDTIRLTPAGAETRTLINVGA